MEKLQSVVKAMYVNRFWITCGVVAVASLITWFLASSSIDAAREKNARNLDIKHTAIKSVLTTSADTGEENVFVSAHPNAGTEKGMEARIDVAAQAALKAWQLRYQEQAEILKYAPELPPQVRQAMANNSPPEKLPFGKKDPIDDNVRETFGMYIAKRMPVLADIIGATWIHDEASVSEAIDEAGKGGRSRRPGPAGAGRPGGGVSAEAIKVHEDNVIWDNKNQGLWNTKVTSFQGRDGNLDSVNRPSTHQMLALQQDLWILEAILNIVADVNEGIEGNDLVPIERIDHVLVGKEAMASLGKLSAVEMKVASGSAKSSSRPGVPAAEGGINKKRKRAAATSSRAQATYVAKSGPKFNEEDSPSPFHGRYVDRDYERLSDKEINQVLTSAQLSEKSYLAVAKRVPVRIAVIMDERKIPDFLAAAVNSPFNFEVRQVRLNKHVPGELAELAASQGGKADARSLSRAGGGAGAGGGAYADSSDTAGAGGGGGSTASTTIAPPEQRSSFDVKVEFVGIIKMYNPVNPALFGVTADADTASRPATNNQNSNLSGAPSAGQ